jgi:DNA-binding transcriptional LysR family regulator
MPDRLSGLEVFVKAIGLGGLSAAARDLGMSPAMAAKHLDALEARLGVTLVRRTTRRLSLTEAGRHFLVEAERLLADLAEAEAQASASTVAIGGMLRVSAPMSLGVLHLAPLVAGFSRLHPTLTVELGLNDRFVDLMEEGWDVAIRIGRLSDSALIARKLAPASAVICASPAYLEARGTPRTVADLKEHNCLGYTLSASAGIKTWSFGVDGAVKTPVRGTLHANNGEALIAAAVAGLGLVYGPRFIAAQGLADGRLRPVQLDLPLMDFGAIQAVTHPDRRPAAKTRAWIDYLAAELSRREGLV